MSTSDYDLAVVGSGAAAFTAAIAARRAGRSVVMAEPDLVGGTCVNTGCVPSKALLAAAEARHVALDRHFPGIAGGAGPVDAPAVFGGAREIVDDMRATKYVDLAADYGWQILPGRASFVDGPALRVGTGDRVRAEHYLIATGSAPWAPPVDGLAGSGYLTSTTALTLDTVPESLLVLGAGYVGLELAQLFARLGSRVTVLARSRLASAEEPEISAGLERIFLDEGIDVRTRADVRAVHRGPAGVTALVGDERLEAERILVATGRKPVTAGLGLDRVGVTVAAGGEVVVDKYLRTGNPRIWAAGDVTGHPQFVYVAAAHGALMVDNAFDDIGRTMDYHHLPRVIFTSPAVGSAGLTERQVVAAGYACECRVLPLSHVPRAVVDRDTRGLIKLVADRDSGRLLGAHVLAGGAGEVITAAVYALANRMTVDRMADLWCPYLTMAEGLKLAAQTFTRDVTKLSCCAA
jgi:mercuric reductase